MEYFAEKGIKSGENADSKKMVVWWEKKKDNLCPEAFFCFFLSGHRNILRFCVDARPESCGFAELDAFQIKKHPFRCFGKIFQKGGNMEVHQFRYNGDNLSYLLVSGKEALAVDAGSVDAICTVVEEKGLALLGVTNTHDHPDHTQGNHEICRRLNVPLLDHLALARKGEFFLGDESLNIIATPGHSLDSVCFVGNGFILTGDTLFNGTVGNCFSGDLDAFFDSIVKILALDPATSVYAGHDYVREAIGFARSIEPENPFLGSFLEAYDPSLVVSTLEVEKKVNPYLRFDDPKMIALLEARGLPVTSSRVRWRSLMEVY